MASHVLGKKARQLEDISNELKNHPYYRLIRPKYFEFAPGITWPLREPLENGGYGIKWDKVNLDAFHWAYLHDLPHDIIKRCNYQPRCILRAIRRIDAAIRWCEKRIEGLNRYYRHVLEQQKKSVQQIEAEYILQKLKEE